MIKKTVLCLFFITTMITSVYSQFDSFGPKKGFIEKDFVCEYIKNGNNVSLALENEFGDYSFSEEFDRFYINNGKKAGTYIYENNKWILK